MNPRDQVILRVATALNNVAVVSALASGLSQELGRVCSAFGPEDKNRPEKLQQLSHQVRQLRQGLDSVSVACSEASDACIELDRELTN